jgi:threonine dehydrogenase-like Zn-dependent dehydrogenase
VLVVGAGPIGLGTAYWARRFGARRVIVTDLNDFQEERALAMGATGFLVSGDDIVQRTNAEIGSPPDVVFECVGKPGVLAQCIEHVRIKGTVVVLGLCTAPDTFVPFRAVSKEVRIQTSAFFDFPEFCRVIDTLESGDATPHALITRPSARCSWIRAGAETPRHQCASAARSRTPGWYSPSTISASASSSRATSGRRFPTRKHSRTTTRT